jgi:hypothetical protein
VDIVSDALLVDLPAHEHDQKPVFESTGFDEATQGLRLRLKSMKLPFEQPMEQFMAQVCW